MAGGWKSPVLERTAHFLRPRYIIANIDEDDNGGYVAFNDPAMYRKEWTGPIYGGMVRYSKAELLRLESDCNSDPKIRQKVEAAKDELLQLVTEYRKKEGLALTKLAVSLLLALFAIIPVSQLF